MAGWTDFWEKSLRSVNNFGLKHKISNICIAPMKICLSFFMIEGFKKGNCLMSIIEMMLTKRELQLWKTRTRRTHEQSRHANKQTCSLAQISHPEALHFFQGLASLSHSRILLFETKPPQITDMLALSLLLFLCDQSVQSAGRFVRRPVGGRNCLSLVPWGTKESRVCSRD